MQLDHLSLRETGHFSQLVCDYLEGQQALSPLYKYAPNWDSFEQVLADKASQKLDRELLVTSLQKQYEGINASEATQANIELLAKPDTFSVTTAHQPLLFTGPMYFVFKILSAIKLCRQLKEKHPDKDFVPLYWVGSEDHDLEEVNHTYLFGKKISWTTGQTGPVGRMTTERLDEAVAELGDILGDRGTELTDRVKAAYQADTYGKATVRLMNELFSDYGLLILNQDDADLKAAFADVIKDELENTRSSSLIEDNLKFLQDNYHQQAHPREINLFYLGEGFRARIERDRDNYSVVDKDLEFTKEELLQELEQHPERFSPNVILRPLYQESILPNVAFIGGPGEVAYWLQLKPIFEHYGVNYPMLLLRDTAMLLDNRLLERMEKLDLSIKGLFGDIEQLIKDYVRENTGEELSLASYKQSFEDAFNEIAEQAQSIDPTLEKPVLGESQKLQNALSNIEAKMIRAEKKKHDNAVNQMRKLHEKLFPEGVLMERHENFLPYLMSYGNGILDQLLDSFDPLDARFKLIKLG